MHGGSGAEIGWPRLPRPVRRRSGSSAPRHALLAALVVLLVVSGFAAAASFQIRAIPESLGAVTSSTEFLTHWQFEGVAVGATPNPPPRVWSAVVTAPTRLPRASAAALLNIGAAGHAAAAWTFNETVGMPVSTEVVVSYTVVYVVAGVTHTATGSVYIESQRAAPAGPLTFTVYWDSGHPTGVTLVSLLEVSQVCPAVGTCP